MSADIVILPTRTVMVKPDFGYIASASEKGGRICAWRAIATMPPFKELPEHILLWNPCDGPHLIWTSFEGPRIETYRDGAMFTAWCECPKPYADLRKRRTPTP